MEEKQEKAKTKRTTREQRIRQRNLRLAAGVIGIAAVLAAAGGAVKSVTDRRNIPGYAASDPAEKSGREDSGGAKRWQQEGAPYIDVRLLTPNSFSRPQLPIESVKHIAVHYTANPGSSAMANRDYFENLAVTQETKVSSHFVVGIEGEVVQCIPTSEMSYATNERNVDTVSIECCHPDESGKFSEAAYDSVVKLAAWLCTRFGLTADDVIRHYDVTGKICPKYYVENPDAWEQMKADIAARIQEDYELQAASGA